MAGGAGAHLLVPGPLGVPCCSRTQTSVTPRLLVHRLGAPEAAAAEHDRFSLMSLSVLGRL